MKKAYILLASLLVSSISFGQKNFTDQTRYIQTAGSATKLEGKILQVHIFVKLKDGPSFSKTQKTEILKILPHSENWLKREAGKYGKSLTISNKTYGTDKDFTISSDPDPDTNNEKWTEEVLKQMGYDNPMDFYDELKAKDPFDQMYIVYFINTEAQSYSMPCDKDYEDDDAAFVESAAVFNNFEGKIITDKTEEYVVPHEILHLFGTLDLYKGPHQSEESQDFAIKTVQKSIMLGSEIFLDEDEEQWELPQYEIDEFNAYIMGLHNNYKKWYDVLAKKFAKSYK